VWQLLSLLVGALVAVGLLFEGGWAIESLSHWPFIHGLFGVVIIVLSAGLPTWLVGCLHPRLSCAHLLAYFAALLSLFVLIGLLNLQVEL
jgi:hypothetical protein